jgi:RNA polymerase sigma factor (sigma-70 family)
MTSDPAPLARLADVLARAAGRHPTPHELAELVWLAGHDKERGPAQEPTDAPPAPPHTPAPSETDDASPEPAPQPAREPGTTGHAPLHTAAASTDRPDEDGAGGAYASLLAPTPPMLPHPLALQRALRPLKRHVPSPAAWELDEGATARRIAREGARPGAWLPVLRPRPERWLSLHLVFDTGPTMPIWRPLVRGLHTAIVQTGAFRTVELWRATADGALQRHRPSAAAPPPTHSDALPPGNDRTVVLVLSDCMGPQWRDTPSGRRWYRTLHRCAGTMPVALLQPLPERLWRRAALPVAPGLLTAPRAVAPNSALSFAAYEPEPLADGALPLPVLEPTAPWISHWATLVAGPGGVEVPGTVAHVTGLPPEPDPAAADAPDVTSMTPEDLVLRFRSIATPEAFRLAGHVAVCEPYLPVMRLVHAAIDPHPQPQQLAEVVLSGMLRAVPGVVGRYEFRPGVREVLLRTLPRSAVGHTVDMLTRVSAEIAANAGAVPGEFRALVPLLAGRGSGGTAVDGEPFALVSRETLGLLRGPVGSAATTRTVVELAPARETVSAAPVERRGPRRYSVLGPVEVSEGDEKLNVGSPQNRALLCALLLKRGDLATADQLVDAIWGAEPPASARAALRTYASRLRKVLGASALVSRSGGYELPVDDGQLDLQLCEDLAASAEIARATGDIEGSHELLTSALELWRGEPLAGVPGPFAERERARLKEWHLSLRIMRLELDLELGWHVPALPELADLVEEHPFHETLRVVQMLALERSGRAAEALESYRDIRHRLAQELDVRPGSELRELEARIRGLEQDPQVPFARPRTVLALEVTSRSKPRPTLRHTIHSALHVVLAAGGALTHQYRIDETGDGVVVLIDPDIPEQRLLNALLKNARSVWGPMEPRDLRIRAVLHADEDGVPEESVVHTATRLLKAAPVLESSWTLCLSDPVYQRYLSAEGWTETTMGFQPVRTDDGGTQVLGWLHALGAGEESAPPPSTTPPFRLVDAQVTALLDPAVGDRIVAVAGHRDRRLPIGSGLLLTSRLILTAAHLLPTRGDRFSRVLCRSAATTRAGGDWTSCQVVWQRDDTPYDVALLLAERPMDATADPIPLDWGEAADTLLTPCHFVGYRPADHWRRFAEVEQVTGTVVGHAESRYLIECSAPVNPRSRWWEGMSGAPLIHRNQLLGLMVSVNASSSRQANFQAVPSSLLLEDPDFVEVLTRHLGRPPEPISGRSDAGAGARWSRTLTTLLEGVWARTQPGRPALFEELDADALVDGGEEDPAEIVEQRERGRELARAVNSLSEREKAVITLRFFERFTTAEIARTLGVTERTVHRLQRDAEKRLRTLLPDL